jgi:hypothetical protein
MVCTPDVSTLEVPNWLDPGVLEQVKKAVAPEFDKVKVNPLWSLGSAACYRVNCYREDTSSVITSLSIIQSYFVRFDLEYGVVVNRAS